MKESHFQLRNQKLLFIKYGINETFIFPKDQNLELQINSEIIVNKKEEERVAEVRLKIKVFEEQEDPTVPFKLEVVNKGLFKWSQEVDDKIDTLLNMNAPAILLSYVRPLITQFTSYSNYPPLILPLMDFTKEEK